MALSEPAHPLFPLPEDADEDASPPAVHFITVTRREVEGIVTAPRNFPAEELTSLEQLSAMYGGGTYELLARGENNARIVARRGVKLPGKSLPMLSAPEEEPKPVPSGPDPATLVRLLAQAQQAQAGGGFQSILALLTVLAPVFGQWLQASAQASAAQQQQSQQFMQTMLTMANGQSDKLVTVMGQLYQARPSGGASADGGSFTDGVEWVQNFLSAQMEAKGEGGDDLNLGQLLKDLLPAAMQAMQQKPAAVHTPLNSGTSS